MILSAIVALDRSGLIGAGGGIPWHLPADLKRFRRLTIGKPIVMGRRTFESIGRPLPERTNIVVTRRGDFGAAGCLVADSVEAALALARDHLARHGGDEAVVIGGAGLYEATAPLCDRLLLTVVEGDFAGDTHFPLGALAGRSRTIVAREYHPADERNPHPHWFFRLDLGREGADPTGGPLDPAGLIAEASTGPQPLTR